MTATPLLQVKRLCAEFVTPNARLPVLDNVNFDVREGEILGIVGESGSGKTVTALSLTKLLPAKLSRSPARSVAYSNTSCRTFMRSRYGASGW